MKKSIFLLVGLLSSACASTHITAGSPPQKCYLEKGEPVECYSRPAIAETIDASAFEYAFSNEPWYENGKNKKRPNIGIASGGGGTKASSFSMGVIKRLVDDGNIKKVDIISSVSGGGHPVSYLYAKARYAQLMDVADCPAAEIEDAKAIAAKSQSGIHANGYQNERDFAELQCMYLHLSQFQMKFPDGSQLHTDFPNIDFAPGAPRSEQIIAIPTNDLISAAKPDNLRITKNMYTFLNTHGFTQAQLYMKDENGDAASAIQSWQISKKWNWDGLHEPEFKCFVKGSTEKFRTLNYNPNFDKQSAHRAFTWHRCWQDMASHYSSEIKAIQGKMWLKRGTAIAGGIGITALSLPYHHAANTVFDWQADLSPFYYIQKNGNERLGLDLPYGISDKWDRVYAYDSNDTDNIDGDLNRKYYRSVDLKNKCSHFEAKDINSSPLNFTDLKCAEQLGLPMWVINATTPTRSLLDFRRTELSEMDKYRFEFTAHGFGSHKYGFIKNENNVDIYDQINLSLPQAMSSSYAFLDGRQRVMFNFPYGLNSVSYAVIEGGAHAVNLNWSISIPNYNMKKNARTAYHFLPAPLNFYGRLNEQSHRAHIPLADGGINRDGLGILPLLERQTKNIVLINQGATISDLCQFNKFLKDRGLEFRFHGDPRKLAKNNEVDYDPTIPIDENGLCADGFWDEHRGSGLNSKAWTRPVWKGEIRKIDTDGLCLLSDGVATSNADFCTKIYFIMSNSYTPEKAAPGQICMAEILQTKSKDELLALMEKSKQVNDISTSNPAHTYPPTLCGWLYENPNSDFPADGMMMMTVDSSQDLSNAYMDLGWFLAGGLDALFEDN